ncbi:MAG: hypothetical protein WCD18_14230 [Thermosynechococcaceae cyanobacterium]
MSALPNSVLPSRSRRSQPQNTSAALRNRPASAQRPPLEEVSNTVSFRAANPSAKLWESGTIVGVNVLLIGTALVTLAHLVPDQLAQWSKLKELKMEQSQVARTVTDLQQDFKRSQSPDAVQRIAQEQGNLIPANQKSVYLMPPSQAKVQ